MTSYTPSQIRAFEWLPADRGWRDISDLDEHLPVSLMDLSLVRMRTIDGTTQYRLTYAGIAERARLAKEGVIK